MTERREDSTAPGFKLSGISNEERNAALMGEASGNNGGFKITAHGKLAKTFEEAKAKQAEKSSKTISDIAFLTMLNDQINRAEDVLRDRYGGDYLNSMAAKYGIEAEGKTKEEIRTELIDRLSSDEFENDPDAQSDLEQLLRIEEGYRLSEKGKLEIKQTGTISEDTRKASEEYISKADTVSNLKFYENSLDVTLSDAAKEKITSDIENKYTEVGSDLDSLSNLFS